MATKTVRARGRASSILLLLFSAPGARAESLEEPPPVWQPQLLRGRMRPQQPASSLVWQPQLQGYSLPMLVPPPAATGRPELRFRPEKGGSSPPPPPVVVEDASSIELRLQGQGPCAAPFASVDENTAACVAAAEAARAELPCRWAVPPLLTWAERVTEVDQPLWPRGCFVREGSQGDCELIFNPTGSTQESATGSGPRQTAWKAILCQSRASSASVVV